MTNSGSDASRPRASARVPGASQSRPGHQYGGKTYGGGGGRSRRTPSTGGNARRFVLLGLVLSLFATVAGVGVWGYAASLDSDFSRMDAFDGLQDRPVDAGGLNMLVLGSDSRNPDSDEGSRSDTMILIHVPSDGSQAFLVSLPRDLWVNVPPSSDGQWGGGESKLNAAMAYGGIPLMVETVEGYTNVLIDHVVEIDFDGLIEVVDALGGVTMDVQPADDGSGELTSIHEYKSQDKEPRTWKAGEQKMDGEEALDYVRQRKQFNEGDFARMRHQQELLMAMMDSATSSGTVSNPVKLNEFVSSVIGAMKVDNDFEVNQLTGQLYHLRSDDLVFLTSPNAGDGYIGDESVVLPDEELATEMYTSMAADDMASWYEDNPDATSGGASDDAQN